MYCRSEILLLHQNIYCHCAICYAHVRKPSLYSKIWAPPHERVHNGLVPAPSSYRAHTGFSPCAPLVSTRRNVEYVQNFRRVSPATNGPLTCSPIAQRPAVCPHRVPSPCSTVRTKFTTRWHTVGLAGAMWRLHYLFQRRRYAHGENGKLELYEDRELGTRPGRIRYVPVWARRQMKNNSAGEIFGWFFIVLDSSRRGGAVQATRQCDSTTRCYKIAIFF